MKNVVQDLTSAGLDWDREKWRGSVASKFIRGGEKNAVKYADEIIVLSKDVQKYFLETYGRETHFIPNGVNRPEVREAKLITDHFGLGKIPIYCSSVVWCQKRVFDIWLRPSRMSRRIKSWLSQAALVIRIPLWRN